MKDESLPVLIVFLKFPETGKVKTRLAADIGPEAAAALYSLFVTGVLAKLQAVRHMFRVVGCFDGASVDAFKSWDKLVDEWLPQSHGDLGARVSSAFEWGHKSSDVVVAIGTDCLEISYTHFVDTIARLSEDDVVIGPAKDGGYYLIATRKSVAGLFDQVRWSSPHTLDDQLIRCRQLGLRVALLEELADIDTLEDWQAYERRVCQA